MKEIDKNDYCIHGRHKAKEELIDSNSCKCCGNWPSFETKEKYGKDIGYCTWCLTQDIQKELMV